MPYLPYRTWFLFLGSLFLTGFMWSCNTTKFLDEDELLLTKNDVRFTETQEVSNRRQLLYELSTVYQQQTNSNFFFIPREWFYFKTSAPKDTSKVDNWVRRVIAEPPAIHDREAVTATEDAMQRFMQYRGYFNAEVSHEQKVRGKKIKVTYLVTPEQQFSIDSAFFSSPDPKVNDLLHATRDESLLQPGAELTGTLYEQERERITRMMRNRGYAFFLPNYVAPLDADTTLANKKANVYLEVITPPEDSVHRQYTVGEISIFPDYDPLRQENQLLDTTIQGFLFRLADSTFETKPRTLIARIYLQKGELFRKENFDRTNRAISSLGIFRFVRIKQEIDSLDQEKLNFRLELTPMPKIEVGVDVEFNYTNRNTSAASGNLIGFSVSPSLRNRNVFKGAELLLTNLSAGVEVNPSAINTSRFWNTVDLRVQSELYFPRFNDYLGLYRLFNKLPINKSGKAAGTDFYNMLQENGATRLSASYNYLLLLDFYRYNLFNASYGFDIRRGNTHRYLLNHIGIDYLRPFTEPAFEEILDSNPFLARSFGQQLFVSLLFRDLNIIFNSRPNRFGKSSYVGFNIEMAGAEIWAGNVLYNAIASEPDTLTIGNTDFSQYVKSEIDLRRYLPVGGKNTFAARFALGIALPFGFTSDVPYVKQFFVGGPGSIRGWPARSLGPGGYEDTTFNVNSVKNLLLFYQTGDIKLEFNLEYRFDLFWRLKGALFLDGGNIWTLKADPDRCGSQFRFSNPSSPCSDDTRSRAGPFYSQIALSSGMGVRLDLSYFIFRLDMGIRLRNPFPLRGTNGSINEQDYWTDWSSWSLGDINYNIGLGYPF